MWIQIEDEHALVLAALLETATTAKGGPDLVGALAQKIKAQWEEEQSLEYKAFQDAAKKHRLLSEGTLEVDEGAVVSTGADPGAYVMAWLWITAEEAGVNQAEEEEGSVDSN